MQIDYAHKAMILALSYVSNQNTFKLDAHIDAHFS